MALNSSICKSPEMFRALFNVTVPVGVPPLPVTVAVNVTDCPKGDGLGAPLTAVVVAVLPVVTCWLVDPTLDAKLVSE